MPPIKPGDFVRYDSGNVYRIDEVIHQQDELRIGLATAKVSLFRAVDRSATMGIHDMAACPIEPECLVTDPAEILRLQVDYLRRKQHAQDNTPHIA